MHKEVEEVRKVEGSSEYVAPQIEKVITPDDLAREVHYAGASDAVSLGQP
jgi:hypothetical protein